MDTSTSTSTSQSPSRSKSPDSTESVCQEIKKKRKTSISESKKVKRVRGSKRKRDELETSTSTSKSPSRSESPDLTEKRKTSESIELNYGEIKTDKMCQCGKVEMVIIGIDELKLKLDRNKTSTIHCDKCGSGIRVKNIYHCPLYQEEHHEDGYEICSTCFEEIYKKK